MPRPALHDLPGPGPEDVVVDGQGRVIAGLEDGRIVRVTPADRSVETLADTKGRPLGVEVDTDGSLVVCDAYRGLLRVDPETGTVSELVGASQLIDGWPLRVCNNAAIARDGTISKRAVEKHVNSIFAKLELTEAEKVSRRVKAALMFLADEAPAG